MYIYIYIHIYIYIYIYIIRGTLYAARPRKSAMFCKRSGVIIMQGEYVILCEDVISYKITLILLLVLIMMIIMIIATTTMMITIVTIIID